MTIKQLRQKQHDAATAALALSKSAEGRDFTTEEQAKYDALKAEMAQNKRLIEREEERMEIEREAAGRDFDARQQGGGAQVGKDLTEDAPFKSPREFLGAVMDHGMSRGAKMDARLRKFQATQGSDEQSGLSDPAGGFLVPVTVSGGVMSVTAEQDPLAALVTDLPMRSPHVIINARVDKDHSTSVSGGLTVSRTGETADGTPGRMTFEPIQMNATKLVGITYATEEILVDSPESFIALLQAGYADEFGNAKMSERINGNGNGQFLGVLNSPCLISVSKETGQAASTIVKENIDKMESRCWRYGSSAWLGNYNTRPQLKSLVQVVGTGGNAVPYFTVGADGQEMLSGRPIFFTEHCKTLGTAGDLILGNWSQYLEGTYQPMQQAESMHVRFVGHERCFKFWTRNCGQPWWRAALQPKNGNTLSPFVALASRS